MMVCEPILFQFTTEMLRSLLRWYSAVGKGINDAAKNNYERSLTWKAGADHMYEQFKIR